VADLLDLGPLPGEAEYTELFLFQLTPYASVYLGPEGMLGGEALDRIAGFWRALQQEPPVEPDHLAVMLGFYARLMEEGHGRRFSGSTFSPGSRPIWAGSTISDPRSIGAGPGSWKTPFARRSAHSGHRNDSRFT
jgi:hypothetical protein